MRNSGSLSPARRRRCADGQSTSLETNESCQWATYLQSFVLDEFLHAVRDVEEAVDVVVADVTGVQPSVGVDRTARRLLIAKVALHHDGTPHANFPVLVRSQRPAGLRIHHLRLTERQSDADATKTIVCQSIAVCPHRRFRHSVAL